MTDSAPTTNAILDAAIGLFIARGFEKTPMDAIAQAAGVAKGTLYYHFKSKEGIVDAVLERFAGEMSQALAAVETDPALGFAEKLASWVLTMYRLNSQYFGQLHRLKSIDIHERLNALTSRRFAPGLGRLLEEGRRQGACRTAHPLESAEFFLAACHCLLDPEEGPERVGRRLRAMNDLAGGLFGIGGAVLATALKPLDGLLGGSAPGH